MFPRLLAALTFLISATALAGSPADSARADIQKTFGFLPTFLKGVPDSALPGAWEEMKALQLSDKTALPLKVKELIGLAVAAQIPCKYCVYGHTQIATKLGGASQQEVGEAVTMGALARHWSTFFNGIQLDETKFRADINQLVTNAKKGPPANPPAPVNVVDAASAYKDVEQSFGFVPDFIKQFPPEAVAGAWKEMRDVEMSPNTALSGKHKSLIGLAVSSQIPCKYCVLADTEFAKLEGATDREVREAVAMAALVRHWSTLLNGLQVDEATYRKEIDRLVKGAASAARGSSK
jgi:AhpD family alkylhydroperoxidase